MKEYQTWYHSQHRAKRNKEKNDRYHAARQDDRLREYNYIRARAWRLRAKYSLTLDDYDQILAGQGGVCAICLLPPKEKSLSVDHDHKTGLVRGLLCWNCNTSLGKYRDNVERLQRAAAYVTDPPATKALGREVYGRKGRTTKKHRKRRRKT